MHRKSKLILVVAGLLITASVQIAAHFTVVSDLIMGLSMGLGIGLLISALIPKKYKTAS